MKYKSGDKFIIEIEKGIIPQILQEDINAYTIKNTSLVLNETLLDRLEQVTLHSAENLIGEETKKIEQLTMIQIPKSENTDSQKRKWENAFQKWSNKESQYGRTPYGCCGFGAICDWCDDNTYGRPCVRALNKMCREKGIYLNYTNQNFEKIWQGFVESEK